MGNGVLVYASCPRELRLKKRIEKKFEKKWKKFLTNGKRYANITQLSGDSGSTEKAQINLKKLEKSSWQMKLSVIEWASFLRERQAKDCTL